jgi:hypothetical protein
VSRLGGTWWGEQPDAGDGTVTGVHHEPQVFVGLCGKIGEGRRGGWGGGDGKPMAWSEATAPGGIRTWILSCENLLLKEPTGGTLPCLPTIQQFPAAPSQLVGVSRVSTCIGIVRRVHHTPQIASSPSPPPGLARVHHPPLCHRCAAGHPAPLTPTMGPLRQHTSQDPVAAAAAAVLYEHTHWVLPKDASTVPALCSCPSAVAAGAAGAICKQNAVESHRPAPGRAAGGRGGFALLTPALAVRVGCARKPASTQVAGGNIGNGAAGRHIGTQAAEKILSHSTAGCWGCAQAMLVSK